jgi:hypothetical protein
LASDEFAPAFLGSQAGGTKREEGLVKAHRGVGLVAMFCVVAAPLRAQSTPDTTRSAPDSIEERLERAEAAIQRLQNELEAQSQAKVQSRLQNLVEISGLVLFNGFWNGARFNNEDVPQWLAGQQDTTGLPNSRIGALLRQTRLGITVRPGRVLGAELTADLQMDFFGGEPADAVDRLVSPPRIRTADLRFAWPHVRVMVGQDKPLVSPQIPVSFAAIGYPEFAGSGNLWYWIPQARVTIEADRGVRLGLQAAVLDPLQETDANFATPSQTDLGEKSGRPAVEGRAYLAWGRDEGESTIGLGAHRAWLATSGVGTLTSQALTVDFHLVFGSVALTGEGFTGQALGGLGDGGIGQDIGPQGQEIRTTGGWVQLDVRPTFAWELGAGYGRDDPRDGDLMTAGGTIVAGARLRNVSYEGHVHWRPGGGLLLGVEYRHFQTVFAPATLAADQVNGFVGVFF